MPWIGAAIGAGGSLLGGALGSDSAGDAADAQMRMFREGQNANYGNYLTQLQMNEPFRFGNQQAFNKLLGMFGMESMPYQSAAQLAQRNFSNSQAANNRMGADAVLKLMKQGKSIREISQMGSLKSKAGVANRLSKHLDPQQLALLQRGPMGQSAAAQGYGQPAPGGALNENQIAPGYNYFRQEGQRDLLGSFGAGGQGAFSGNALKGLTEFNQQYANKNMVQPLMQLAGLGGGNQNAMGATQNYGQQQQFNNAQMGDARASGIANQGNIWGNAIGGAAQAAGYGYNQYQNQQQQAYDDYIRYGNQR